MLMTSLEALLCMDASSDGVFRATIPDGWMQGRTVFGGLIGALCVRALAARVPADRRLAALDMTFAAPLGPGQVGIVTRIPRDGRSLTFAEADVLFAGASCVRAQAVYSLPRDTALTRKVALPAPSKPRTDGIHMPFLPGVTPAFTQHFDYWLTEGDLPFSGSAQATMGGYCRSKDHASGVEAVVALADAWPSPLLPLGARPFAASTVRWSLHLLDSAEPPEDGYFWFRSECVAAQHGLATTVGVLYSGERAVAWSEQTVAVFDSKR